MENQLREEIAALKAEVRFIAISLSRQDAIVAALIARSEFLEQKITGNA